MELKYMPQPSQGRSHDAAQERKSEPEKESKKSPNTLIELYGAYHNVLWEDGFHRYCVESFIREHDRLLGGEAVDDFQQEKLDYLIGCLRNGGNSNATINRKLAALSKLLKKAHRMGEIKSLPEFIRPQPVRGVLSSRRLPG